MFSVVTVYCQNYIQSCHKLLVQGPTASKISLALNTLVLTIGGVMTAIVNKSTFMAHDQDLKSSTDAFTAAYEQLLSLCCYCHFACCTLEGMLLWLRASGDKQFDSHSNSNSNLLLNVSRNKLGVVA